jgi:N-acetylneuraminic acid mutarotase
MLTPRTGLGAATVNDKIYAIGGLTISEFMPSIPGYAVLGNRDLIGYLGVNEEYDPITNNWISKASMPTPRILFAIAVYQNKIYCIGGKTSKGYTAVNEVYDPATNTWETKAPIPIAKGWLSANTVNNKIYIISGTSNEVYDPNTDTWTNKTPPPKTASLVNCISAVLDNKIYVVGGMTEDHYYNLNQIYDVETDTWSYGSSPPTSVGGCFAISTIGVLAPKQIYVFGNPANLRQGEEQKFVRIYNPENNTWLFGSDASTSRYNFGGTVLNDTAYLIGGHSLDYPGYFESISTNEKYTPIGYGTTKTPEPTITPSPTPTIEPTSIPEPAPFQLQTAFERAIIVIMVVLGIGLAVNLAKKRIG